MESEMSCCERIKFAMSKLIMECFGTFVFTMLFLSGVNEVMLVGLWVLTIFCWKISASQMNPAVTLAFMLRHDSQKIH
jgi:glycerol uptake facilitator-like aquaporin